MDLRKKLGEKFREALSAVLPIVALVLLLSLTAAPIPSGVLLGFLLGAALLIVGMMLFSVGAEVAMTPMGEHVGSRVTKTRNLRLILILGFLLGVLITVSEPDLQVLARQVQAIPNLILILSVALGVGAFLVLALVRIFYRIPLRLLLFGFYLMFVLAGAFTTYSPAVDLLKGILVSLVAVSSLSSFLYGTMVNFGKKIGVVIDLAAVAGWQLLVPMGVMGVWTLMQNVRIWMVLAMFAAALIWRLTESKEART